MEKEKRKSAFLHRVPFLIFPVLSAILFIAAYPPAVLPWLVFVAPIPLFFFLDQSSFRRAFWGSWLFGLIFMGWVIRWFFASSSLLAEGGVQNYTVNVLATGAVWLVSSIVLSFTFALFGTGWKYLPKEGRIATIPSLWIILEYFRAWMFSIAFIGPESLLGPHWTFGAIGYTAVNFLLILQSAKIFGLYGVSFILISLGVALYVVGKKRSKETIVSACVAGVIFVSVLGYGLVQLHVRKEEDAVMRTFAVVQTRGVSRKPVDYKEFAERVESEADMLKDVVVFDPDVVVLSEGSNISAVYGDRTADFFAEIFGRERARKVIDNAQMSRRGGDLAPFRIFLYDTREGLVAVSDKTLLATYGEFVPYIIRVPLLLFGFDEVVERFEKTRIFKRGVFVPESGLDPRNQPEAVHMCSAIFAPSLWRDVTREYANVLINPTAQTRVRGRSFQEQNEASARFFAVANDRWFVQAARDGFSYIIDNHGFIREKTMDIGPAILIGEVEYRSTIPLSAKIGDWLILGAFLIVATPFLFKRFVNVFHGVV